MGKRAALAALLAACVACGSPHDERGQAPKAIAIAATPDHIPGIDLAAVRTNGVG